MTLMLVMGGGALGAVTRFVVDHLARSRFGTALPWGTFMVNLAGSLLLGLLAGLGTALPGWLGHLVGVGFCGALTTYSTFGHETVRLARTGRSGWAVFNAVGTLVAGLASAACGWSLGHALT
jgi:CrcB protein